MSAEQMFQEFQEALLSDPSATAALRQWCTHPNQAQPTIITAQRIYGDDALLPPDLRDVLEVSDEEPLGYRHVRVAYNDITLSEAHNWFVPARLTEGMNEMLDGSDVPFGEVVAPLGFSRERLASERVPTEQLGTGTILTHRAVLRDGEGRPISLVVECYQAAVLGFEQAQSS
jgi:hypothetical protein